MVCNVQAARAQAAVPWGWLLMYSG